MKVHEYDLSLTHRPEPKEIIVAIGNPKNYEQVVFCGYGEPTLRLKVLMEVARYIKENGGKVRVNTDGLANLVHKRNVLPEMAPHVDALSVSLNAQNTAVYEQHCRPTIPNSYSAVLNFLQLAPHYITDVTATAIDGLEDADINACMRVANNIGAKFRKRILGKLG